MLDALGITTVELLCNYFVHSTILFTCACLLKRCGYLKKQAIAERVWRLAFFGALISAPASVFFSQNLSLSFFTDSQSTDTRVQEPLSLPPSSTTTIELREYASEHPSVVDGKSMQDLDTQPRRLRDSFDLKLAPRAPIVLVQEFKLYIQFIALIWLCFAFVTAMQFALQIRRLNQRVLGYESCQPKLFEEWILATYASKNQDIMIKVTQEWASPIVAPNHVICLPEWALLSIPKAQLHTMLAHEIAHIQRRDPEWSIAYQFFQRIFLFQFMNHIALRELSTLAELACDEAAAKNKEDRRLLAEALFACANAQTHMHIPNLALAMANTSSPLMLRVQSLLDANDAPAERNVRHNEALKVFFFGALTLYIAATCLPNIRFQFENFHFKDQHTVIPIQENLQVNTITSPILTAAEDAHEEASDQQAVRELLTPTKDTVVPISTSTENDTVPTVATSTGLETPHANNMREPIAESWNIDEAKQALASKRYAQAFDILSRLANANDSKAQSLLAEMHWYGEGIAIDLDEAEKWFRLAASKQEARATRFLKLIDERTQKKNLIAFYTGDRKDVGYRYLEDKCSTPVYSTSLFYSNTKSLGTWQKCAKTHLDALRNAKAADQMIIPESLLSILTDREVRKAEENSAIVIEHAIDNILANENEQREQYRVWTDKHPNLVTNAAYSVVEPPQEPFKTPTAPRTSYQQNTKVQN